MVVQCRIGDLEDKSINISPTEILEGRLQSLMQVIGEEISDSYKTCVSYSKEGLVSKVWKSSQWADKLVDHAQRFVKRREDITLALSSHSAHVADENLKVAEETSERTKRIETR